MSRKPQEELLVWLTSGNSLYVDGFVNGRQKLLLLNTGTTKTIVRPDVLKEAVDVRPTRWILRTATEDSARIHGEAEINLQIGNTRIKHQALVAVIENEVIVGLIVMGTNGFRLDLKRGVLQVNDEEIILHRRQEEVVQVVLSEETVIPKSCEVVVEACLRDGAVRGSVMIFEPQLDDEQIGRGIVIGKGLVRADNVIPVRLLNGNGFSVHLKQGTPLGRCYSVSSIVRSVNASDQPSARLHDKLSDLLPASSKGLGIGQPAK